MKRYFLTTAIDYVNSRPHLGTAYEKVCADVIARYKRLCGFDTRFLMGNDEHSQNVYKNAQELGLDPLAYCDQMEQEFRRTWARLDVSFDDFIRTTEPRHRAGVTTLAQRVYDAGDIYEGVYEGWYCVSCEEFKQEKDLVNGNCPLHPTLKPEWIREKNYFFRLSKYQQPLLDHFHAHPDFLEPEIRRNEILRLVESGLIDVSVSRAGQSWGIPLPWDPSSVVYVWFDALINYASAVGLGGDQAVFEQWWPADLHVIGKDITRFHAVIWPAMLMAAQLPLPRQIFGHGFMTMNGQRMSKTLGTIVDPIVAADRLGHDPLRLYLVKEIVFGSDGDFSWERYDERYNADLANNLGNLVSRVTAMAARYRSGTLAPAASTNDQLARVSEQALASYRTAMDRFALHEGAAAAFAIVDATNEFIAATTPWALAKDPANADRLTQVLFDAAEAVRLAAVMLEPIIPSSSREILRRVGAATEGLNFDRDGRWRNDGARTLLQEGPLWPRKEITTVTDHPLPSDQPAPGAHVAPSTQAPSTQAPGTQAPNTQPLSTQAPGTPALGTPAPSTQPLNTQHPSAQPPTDRISIDDFMKIELRVAKVLTAEKVEKSKKLVKLTVDVGTEHRTLVAGIAEAYEPDALVGRTVVIVFNLKPAKLMGIESNGMVLAASPDGGKPELVAFANPPEPGTRVR
ncbi:MAG TPA: methionine--tRNA ligase [Vicinamibacterales bacterium]|nr:methionine--tRNA ligase [Vicinamibacterales bacterium]